MTEIATKEFALGAMLPETDGDGIGDGEGDGGGGTRKQYFSSYGTSVEAASYGTLRKAGSWR